MDDTRTTALVADRDEKTRAFLLDNPAADGQEPLGAQTDEETRLKPRDRARRQGRGARAAARFEAGCDHFVAKPFSYLELRARVRACIRRPREWHVHADSWSQVVDDAGRALHAGQELELSRLEFDLLAPPDRPAHASVHQVGALT